MHYLSGFLTKNDATVCIELDIWAFEHRKLYFHFHKILKLMDFMSGFILCYRTFNAYRILKSLCLKLYANIWSNINCLNHEFICLLTLFSNHFRRFITRFCFIYADFTRILCSCCTSIFMESGSICLGMEQD